jgi:tRNA(Ile)-lysidine synthase
VRGGLGRAPLAPHLFARWLDAPVAAPVAVALSGGGDSVALLHLAKTWADAAGRRLVAMTVDHGLQDASAEWSRRAGRQAAALGIAHRILAWTGAKPGAGLPAAARAARHALLAEAALAAGARVILMGHTADDLMEAELMRQGGAGAPSPRIWSPSPAWPAGRGVFLLRPLLGHRRADLRTMLRALGETWIDDPANDDPRSARTLARRRLGAGEAAPRPSPPTPHAAPCPALASVRQGDGGELIVPRAAFDPADAPRARRLAGALALCAAGTTRPPPTAALDRLLDRLRTGATFAASLAGSRIEAGAEAVRFCREPGERARGGLAGFELPVGASVFDGRFEIVASDPGWRVTALAGLAGRLPPAERRRLRALPPAVRAALPAAVSPDGAVTAPGGESAPVRAFALGLTRLCATLGGFPNEAALWRVAESSAAT